VPLTQTAQVPVLLITLGLHDVFICGWISLPMYSLQLFSAFSYIV